MYSQILHNTNFPKISKSVRKEENYRTTKKKEDCATFRKLNAVRKEENYRTTKKKDCNNFEIIAHQKYFTQLFQTLHDPGSRGSSLIPTLA